MGMNLIIVMLVILAEITLTKKYNCVFGEMYANSKHYWNVEGKPDQIINPQGRMLLSSGSAFRITLQTSDFSTMKTDGQGNAVTTQPRLDFIMKAMQVTQAFYQNRLQVTSASTIYPPNTCFDFNPSAGQISSGFSGTDLVIYVRYLADSGITYGATGVSCKWVTGISLPDSTFQMGRPTVGRIIFNTHTTVDQEAALTNRLFAQITALSLHEVMHILGFDQSLYSTYLDSTGNLYSSTTSSSTLHASRTGGANHVLQTPAVTQWAQNFFNCPSMTGMILENEEGHSNPGSHWQRLTMYDQLMTGTELGAQKAFSGLTFAILKDMGWYAVDDTYNDTVNYGYMKGCSFVNDACYGATTDAKYFCDPTAFTGVSECSTSFLGKATCSDVSGLMADGCGLFGEYFHCVDESSTDDSYQTYTKQQYKVDAFCVKSTLGTTTIPDQVRSRCYPYVCHTSTSSIEFTIGSSTLYCLSSEEGTQKTLTGFNGYLECPVFESFCTQSRKLCPNWCSQNGFCTRGVCNCMQGFYGEDCSITSCTSGQYYNPGTSACVNSCPSGTHQNIYSKTCVSCDSPCSQCREEPAICTSCQSPQYYYDTANSCVDACPSNTYQSSTNCLDCSTGANCATCTGSATTCTSCLGGLYLTPPTSGSCVSTCSGGYPLYDTANMKCVSSCPSDLLQSGSNCNRCSAGTYKLSSSCVSDCGTNKYEDTTNNVCGNCDSTCQECDGQYAQNCTQCKTSGSLNYLYLKMCVSSCPNGFYANSVSGVCQICTIGLNCLTCEYNGGNVRCTACADGYYMHSDNTCQSGCNQYEFKNEWNHSCDSCHADCGDCTSLYSTSCINCRSPNFFLKNSTGGYCLSQCPTQGYTVSGNTCTKCHQTCLQCSGASASDCVSCGTGLYLQNSKCRYVCSPGTYSDNTNLICSSCDSKCAYCFGPTVDNCTACNLNYVLSNFTCATTCPEGYTVSDQYPVCQLTSSGFFS